MQIPLEITFHHMDVVPWAEEEIRARVAKLDRLFDRLIACRVRVDQRAKNTSATIPPVVRIEISIPGRADIVVSHEPDHLMQKFQSPDLHNAINEAFRIAEARLTEYKQARVDVRAQEGRHNGETQHLGQVSELVPERDFGFLLTKEGGQLYFHRNSVLVGDFDALHRGDEVYYVEAVGDTGPTASKVRVKAP